ncbi:BrnT family toxin [Bdellovibrio bacteriovorus]|uniref:BrnT family toxin n=1 Tax=Bdellovibrio bacteriovorus TaxID=959 RepID=UPI001C12A864|nr:BrnT family toxin [Bdellovibrio bacteriovorus]
MKSEKNLKKHGVSFELAMTVFDDPWAWITTDEKHSTVTEVREWIVGLSDNGVLVVVFTKRLHGKVYRIISARAASRRERRIYEDFKKLSF